MKSVKFRMNSSWSWNRWGEGTPSARRQLCLDFVWLCPSALLPHGFYVTAQAPAAALPLLFPPDPTIWAPSRPHGRSLD